MNGAEHPYLFGWEMGAVGVAQSLLTDSVETLTSDARVLAHQGYSDGCAALASVTGQAPPWRAD